MKRLFSTTGWLIVILMLALLLVACERPLQDDEPGATATPLLTEPQTPLPGGTLPSFASPTPDAGYPAPAPDQPGAYPGPGDGEATTPGGETPAGPAATEPVATAQPDGDVVHVVAAGDTLGAIAVQYGITVEAIAAANNLSNIHTLDVGQSLIIPLGGEDPAPGTTAPPQPEAEEQVHIVQSGETLYRIGLRYGFTVEELTAYNNLANPERLDVGQQILIPPQGYTVP